MGMVYYVKNVPNPNPQIVQDLKDILLKVCKYQRKDGSFAWQMTTREGHEDTSATAMICYTMKIGMDKLTVTDNERRELERCIHVGAKSLYKNISGGNTTNCSGECLGFAMYPQVCGTYPWAQGMTLALLASTEQKYWRE